MMSRSPANIFNITVRTHFWQVVILGLGGFIFPVKKGLNGAIPAPINNKVGSSCGIKEALGCIKCPRFAKKFRKASRISLPVIFFIIIYRPLFPCKHTKNYTKFALLCQFSLILSCLRLCRHRYNNHFHKKLLPAPEQYRAVAILR